MFGDSATSRLHRVLGDLRSYGSGTPARRAWVKVLRLPDERLATLLHALGQVISLPEQARGEILALPDEDYEGLLAWFDRVQDAFSVAYQVDMGIEALTSRYREEDVVTLRHASFRVSRHVPDEPLTNDQIATSVDATLELLEALTDDPDLDAESRAALVRAATGILNALQAVRLTGTQGVRGALADAFGLLRLVTDGLPADKRPSIVAQVERVFVDLAAVTQVAMGFVAFAPMLQNAAARLIGQ